MTRSAKAVLMGFAVVVAMFALLPAVSALQCFTCHSMDDEHCSDLKANETASRAYLRDCNETIIPAGATPLCRKTTLTTHLDEKTRVIRRCGYERSSKPCYHLDDEDHSETVCQCFEDACNAARGLQGGATARASLACAAAALLVLLAR